MPKTNCSPLSNDNIKKYSKIGVVDKLEKDFAKQPTIKVSIKSVDDNSFVCSAPMSPSFIENYAEAVSRRETFPPLLVRRKENRYEILCGRKRYYAALALKRWEVEVLTIDVQDEEALLLLLADVRDQKEPNVVELALIYQKLLNEFSYSQNDIAVISHQSRSQIANILRILKNPVSVIQMVSKGEISYGHARAIEPLDDRNKALAISLIREEKLSVRDTEDLVKKLSNHPSSESKSDDVLLQEKFDARYVHINKNNVVFSFENEEERQSFVERLTKL